VKITFSFVVSKYFENPNVLNCHGILIVYTDWKKMEQNYIFIPFLCDLVLLFSSSLWGQISTWQFISTFLSHFFLSQNKLIGFSRSHVKDLAQWWLNFSLCSFFPSVRKDSFLRYCQAHAFVLCPEMSVEAIARTIKYLSNQWIRSECNAM